jgi:hypothetical protein
VEPDGENFDAKIKVLTEYVKHHVKNEQNEMFPARQARSWTGRSLAQKLHSGKKSLSQNARASVNGHDQSPARRLGRHIFRRLPTGVDEFNDVPVSH